MFPLPPEENSHPKDKPIYPRQSYGPEPLHRYTPLPKKAPRKLARDKCEPCREAKKKCETDTFQQLGHCRRCLQKRLKCPGITTTRNPQTRTAGPPPFMFAPEHSELITYITSNTNAKTSFNIEQLKAKPCLVCFALRLSCTSQHSGEVCVNCIGAGHSNILRSRLCMRATPFVDISIFRSCLPDNPILKSLWAKGGNLLNGVSSEFDDCWTASKFLNEVSGFLRPGFPSTDSNKTTSKVGMLCSPTFRRIIQEYIPPQIAFLFQAMLYATSFSFVRFTQTKYTQELSVPTLQLLGAHAGHQVLWYLDSELNPQRLSNISFGKLRALFFLVFGTILTTRYARRTCLNQEYPTANTIDETLWDEMRDHLCEMLAHHLVLLGERIDVKFNENEERSVLWCSEGKWNQKGTYKWEAVAPISVTEYHEPRLGSNGSRNDSYSCLPRPNDYPVCHSWSRSSTRYSLCYSRSGSSTRLSHRATSYNHNAFGYETSAPSPDYSSFSRQTNSYNYYGSNSEGNAPHPRYDLSNCYGKDNNHYSPIRGYNHSYHSSAVAVYSNDFERNGSHVYGSPNVYGHRAYNSRPESTQSNFISAYIR
ncbi:hypothetical protein F4779DRAFT_570079 [Xylariaceae sp. FL0662B]|nr:hypothetical protein F4779DRAFT_570079 [Xylariaceae sp. FL0662B]